MILYGITIEKENAFWDEVKLRAMNNYGDWEKANISYAIRDVLEDVKDTLIESEEAAILMQEIESGQD